MSAHGVAVALAIATPALLQCAPSGPPGSEPPPIFRPAVLETVVVGNRIVPQSADGSYSALPTQSLLRVRVQADANVAVAVDGTSLPRRAVGAVQDAWFEPNGSVPASGSRGYFWDLAVRLPADKRVAAPVPVTLTVAYDVTRTDVQVPPPLTVTLVSWYRQPDWPPLPVPASEVFDEGDNSKPDGRAMNAIVTRGVVLAGWLYEGDASGGRATPHRNDASGLRAGESEDWHYDVWLDNDFIRRNYGNPPLEPVASAIMKGNPVPLFAPGAPAVRLLPLLAGGVADAASFTIPGSELMTAELNAWHKADRGSKPDGWIDDPDTSYPGNAWPFHPGRPLGVAAGDPDLKPGDYVIVSGTLWEDTSHADRGAQDFLNLYRTCWDDKFRGHAGWLEIHPVDSVRKVDPPSLRKHAVMLAACNPQVASFTKYLEPWGKPPAKGVLKHEVLVDSRFTSTNVNRSEELIDVCFPKLRVNAQAGPQGTFKATYVLWWEDSDDPLPRDCPAVNPLPEEEVEIPDFRRKYDEDYEGAE